MLVRSRVAQGYGRLYIQAELRVAGVPDADVTAAVEAVDCDWTQIAADLHARKFGAVPTNMAERNKQYRYLAGRGFTSDQIRVAMKGAVPEED
jgi:regulatory protein